MTVYLSTIFRVIDPGERPRSGEYSTLSSIRQAAPWTRPEHFRQYYDVSIKYDGYFPAAVKHVNIEDYKEIAEDISIKNTERSDGFWPAGSPVKGSLQESIEHEGKTYFLKCSYIASISDFEKEKKVDCKQNTEGPQ